MKVKALQRIFMLLAVLFAAIPAMAQNSVSGRIVESENSGALAGALVTNISTGDVAVSANDGSFRIRTGAGEQTLSVSYLGYHDLEVTVPAGQTALGEVVLQRDAISVADIVVTAGIVTSDRQTPVAISNVTRAQIDMKLSNQEFPEILKSTPSVYATKESGGYGDSRISMRGFGSENIGVLINGVPVNDMENGRVYWSNWSGLSDVTSFMQVQRGLGASKLALSSVGGTINIVTKSTDAEKGGSVYYGIGNDGLQKLNFSVSTGLTDNGWAVTIAGSRQSADGYIRGTNYLAWNYFGNLSKVFAGGKHRLSLTAFGAPQWHNQRGNPYLIEDYMRHPDRRRMNLSWGWKNGEIQGTGYGYNEYHKPQISLVHTWEINSKSMLSTSVYASLARGGGRRIFGPNGASSYLLAVDNTTGKPHASALPRTDHNLIDWDAVYNMNRESVENGNGAAVAVMGMAVNKHDWYGILSTYNNQITDEIKITAGFDGRYYTAFHGSRVDDLLGADYFIDSSIQYRNPTKQLREGELTQYDETGEVLWTGLFAQGEYVKNNLSAFLSASISANFYRWHNPGAPYVTTDANLNALNGKIVSEWVNFLPWSVKAGASYKLGQHHSVFANGGYFTRAPFFNSTFVSYTIKTNPEAKVERVATAELGYQFANNVFNVTFNGYYTLWLDKGMTRTLGTDIYNISGLNARHMGLELEATYRPSTRFSVKAMGSIGDWIWRDDVDASAYDEAHNLIEDGDQTLFIAGVHVGNSAQITAALGLDWEPFKNVRLGADYNWFGKNFADFQPTSRTQIQDKVDAWQMPDYGTVDVQVSYRFNIGDKIRATFYGNVNNLLDTWYIADARDGKGHDARSALVYYGFGRTWTAGLKFNF